MTRQNTLGTMLGMFALASVMNEGMLGNPDDIMLPSYGIRKVAVKGNFSGTTTPANLKKNRKKPVTMRRPKSKKRKH